MLLVSEWFPPAFGGSGELLANIYSRVSTQTVDVITDLRHAAAESAIPASPFHIVRTRFGSQPGLFGRESLPSQLRLVRQMRRMARTNTVIHCGRALPEGSAAWLSRLSGGQPYVCWTHGEELSYAATSRELSWLLRRVHRGAAALLANCQNTATLLRGLGNPPARIHVVYPGVDADRFHPSVGGEAIRGALLKDGELLLLSVGRLQVRKGHDLVIRALSALAGTGPRLRYAIAGDGEERGRLERLAAEQGVADRVHFVGRVAPMALPAYYAAADIFVHPNRVDGTDFEGFGLVFLEAAASGLPSIGGRSGGVPEAIEEDRTGLLVSGADVEELARAIRRLADSGALRTELGTAARARVLSQFSWTRAARQVDAIDADVRRPGRLEEQEERPAERRQ